MDTAAQHGLIGQETLSKLDQHLANQFGMRIKHTNEDGGAVRGVCWSEERAPIAYVPIGIGGCSGLLRVQIVPGAVPCLLPAYLLTDMGSVIDMVGLNMYHTRLGVTQQMHRRATGHVEVCVTEYGKGFHMPSSASFGKSQVWAGGPFPNPIRTADASISMLASMETLLLALALGGLDAGYQLVADGGAATRTPRRPTFGGEARAAGAPGLRRAAEGGSAFGSFEKDGGDQRANPDTGQGRWRVKASGGSASAPWPESILGASSSKLADMSTQQGAPRLQPRLGLDKVRGLGAVEQIPKLTPDKLTEWNSVLVYQAPSYQTPAAVKEAKEAKKAAKAMATSTSSTTPVPTAWRGASPTRAPTARPTALTTPAASARPTSNGGYGKSMGSSRDPTEPQPRTDGPERGRGATTSSGDTPEWTDGGGSMEHRRARQCSLSAPDFGWRLGRREGDTFEIRLCLVCQQEALKPRAS